MIRNLTSLAVLNTFLEDKCDFGLYMSGTAAATHQLVVWNGVTEIPATHFVFTLGSAFF
jgi:hypothetical protein